MQRGEVEKQKELVQIINAKYSNLSCGCLQVWCVYAPRTSRRLHVHHMFKVYWIFQIRMISNTSTIHQFQDTLTDA